MNTRNPTKTRSCEVVVVLEVVLEDPSEQLKGAAGLEMEQQVEKMMAAMIKPKMFPKTTLKIYPTWSTADCKIR